MKMSLYLGMVVFFFLGVRAQAGFVTVREDITINKSVVIQPAGLNLKISYEVPAYADETQPIQKTLKIDPSGHIVGRNDNPGRPPGFPLFLVLEPGNIELYSNVSKDINNRSLSAEECFSFFPRLGFGKGCNFDLGGKAGLRKFLVINAGLILTTFPASEMSYQFSQASGPASFAGVALNL